MRRRGRGRVALQEREGDLAPHVGEQLTGAGPEGGECRRELVARRDPRVDQVGPCPDDGPQRSRLRAERPQLAQVGPAQAQVVGDDLGVARVALGTRPDLGLAPGLDGGRLDRHDRMARREQAIDEPAVGSLDGDRQLGRMAVPGEATDEMLEPSAVWLIVNRSATRPAASMTQTACSSAAQSIPVNIVPPSCGSTSSAMETSPGRSLTGALRRVPLLPVSRSRGTGGGGVIVAHEGQPT